MISFEIPQARENEHKVEVKQTRNESLMNNKDAKTCENNCMRNPNACAPDWQAVRARAGAERNLTQEADSPHAFVLISFSQLHRWPHIRHPRKRNAPHRNE
jgi:hypothetical protein